MSREPSGKRQRPSSTERAETIMSVALEARERVFGLSPDQARSMPETSPLGRLRATREISMRQYEAGARFQRIAQDYDKAMLAKGVPSGGDLNRSRSFDADDGTEAEYVAWCRKAIARYKDCHRALEDANREDRNAAMATKLIAVVGFDKPELVASLRVGLNAIAHVLQLPPDPTNDRMRVAA
jgi:hypothetical protein